MEDLEEGVVYITAKFLDNEGVIREEVMKAEFQSGETCKVCLDYIPADGNGCGSTMRPTNPR